MYANTNVSMIETGFCFKSASPRKALVPFAKQLNKSIERGMDRRFCSIEINSGPCVTRVMVDILILGILKGEGKQPEVMVHITTNDIGRKDEEARYQFKEQDLSNCNFTILKINQMV